MHTARPNRIGAGCAALRQRRRAWVRQRNRWPARRSWPRSTAPSSRRRRQARRRPRPRRDPVIGAIRPPPGRGRTARRWRRGRRRGRPRRRSAASVSLPRSPPPPHAML